MATNIELVELLARKAGLIWSSEGKEYIGGGGRYDCQEELAKLVSLVVEECANVAESHHILETPIGPITVEGCRPLALMIRQKFKAL